MASWNTDPSYLCPSELAFEEGKHANHCGDSQSACPYNDRDQLMRKAWLHGWQVAQLDRDQWETENHERAVRYGE